MSTYLDRPLQLPSYQSDVPLELLLNVGMSRQNEYNTNYKSVQGQVDRLGQYPILKDSDRQVIASKMNDLVSRLNEFSGQDLGDTRVYNQLVGLTNNFYNDKEVYEKIADNTRASNALKDYQKMIKDDPSTYGATNSYVFNKAYNDWLNTPDKSFNASYTPYYDNTDEVNKIIDRVKKDPDITMKSLPDGSKVPMGLEEIKKVTSEKIQSALKSSLSSQALNQYKIDYQASMDGHTVPSTVADINAQIKDVQKLRDAYEANKLSASTSEEWTKMYKSSQDAQATLDQLEAKKQEVITKNDPSAYHTFESFLGPKIKGIGDSYAYEQDGKIEWNPFALEDYKTEKQKELEKWKNDLKLYNAENGYITTGKGKLATGLKLPMSNDYKEIIKQVAIEGHAHANSEVIQPLLGTSGKINDDGSFTVPFQNEEVAVDLQPLLTGQAATDANKGMAMYSILHGYDEWKKGKPLPMDPSTAQVPVQTPTSDTTRGGQWMSSNQSIAANDPHTKVTPNLSFDNWVTQLNNTEGGRKYIADVKSKFNLDLTNPNDVSDARSMANSPAMTNIIGHIGTFLQNNALHGRLNVVPAQGENVIRGSDGQPYVKVLVQAPKSRFLQAFNEWGITNSSGGGALNNMIDKGIITHTTDSDKKGNDLYQMSMYVRANNDLKMGNNQWVRDELLTKGKATFEQAPVYEQDFQQTMDKLKEVKDYLGNPNSIDLTTKHLDELGKTSPELLKAVPEVKKILEQYKAALSDPGTSADKKYELWYEIKAINEAKSTDDIKNALGLGQPTEGHITLPEIQQQYFNKTFSKEYLMQNMDRVMKSIGVHEGHTSTVQSQTGALGSYQFLPSTLKKIWLDNYNGKFNTFEDFKGEFLKNQGLQDNVMRQWLLNLGAQVGYNPWKIAMLHFLGPKGKDLDAVDWGANPTANKLDANGKPIQNVTPATYIQNFTNAYGGV